MLLFIVLVMVVRTQLLPAAELGNTRAFLENHCYDCHDGETQKGGLNLESLSRELKDGEVFEKWVLIHDRVHDDEMPPKKKGRPQESERVSFVNSVSQELVEADRGRIALNGRAKVRRVNRFEYENCLREGLNAPWLQVADLLPEDGVSHLFNKVGGRLDVSHVQISKYLETAEHALRLALESAAHRTVRNRFYAREEPSMQSFLRWKPNIQTAATRAVIPLLGTTPQPEIIRGNQPITVGAGDPETREKEAMGFVSGTYTATTKYDFGRIKVPIDGRYRIRMKTYTFMAGPNGASGGDDHGLTGGHKAWWRPSRTVAFKGTRSEPITLYALGRNGDSRWLTTFDSLPEPQIVERDVNLKAGEIIRPDAARLVRTRPGWKGNPNATPKGVPGFAMNWLEFEGPLHDAWPPPAYSALFDDLNFEISGEGKVRVLTDNPGGDARRLIRQFVQRMMRKGEIADGRAERFFGVYEKAGALGEDFTDSMIAAFAAVLCSSEFLFLDAEVGNLNHWTLASRLSFFLWNGPPDRALLDATDLAESSVLRRHTERLMVDPRSERFVNAFLDYWLDLRDINVNAPDAELYPDYYLDDMLTESSLLETRAFFTELMRNNLSAGNLIDSDFAFVNERLASHYELPAFEGVALRKVGLPAESPRGGLLTQASVLRVTANGTTTSPVVRGAWMMERVLGVEIPVPPSGVAAIDPDTRGATTIREQLAMHREVASCAVCHIKIDPVGFALESFDIAGGWQGRYRAIGTIGDPIEGIGKNGHLFKFRHAQPVDSSGEMPDGRRFADINELKKHLLEYERTERTVARNLVKRLIVYATGAPVSFGDRSEVERILDQTEQTGYGVQSIIHAVVQSELFRRK